MEDLQDGKEMCDPSKEPDPRLIAECGCGPNQIKKDIRSGDYFCKHGAWTGDQIYSYNFQRYPPKK